MHQRVWNNCLKVIKDNVPSISYRTWFEPIVPLKLDSSILTIQVPSPFFYEYLEEKYIDKHNNRFSMSNDLADVHRSLEGYNLNNIFCYQTERQVKNDYTITLGARYIQLERNGTPLPLPKRYVTVRRWLDDSLHIFYKVQELSFSILTDKPKIKTNVVRKPKEDHPWKKWNIGKGKKFRGIPILRKPEVTPVGLRPPSVTSGNILT